jgi:hypothetical protein
MLVLHARTAIIKNVGRRSALLRTGVSQALYHLSLQSAFFIYRRMNVPRLLASTIIARFRIKFGQMNWKTIRRLLGTRSFEPCSSLSLFHDPLLVVLFAAIPVEGRHIGNHILHYGSVNLWAVLYIRHNAHALRHRLPLQRIVHDHASHCGELGIIIANKWLLLQKNILLDFEAGEPSHDVSPPLASLH